MLTSPILKIIRVVLFSITFICFGQTNNDVTIIKNSGLNLIDKSAKIEVLGGSFIVSEGPLWDSENNELIFSDVRQNKIFTWSESNGIKEYILPSGSTGYAPSFKKGGIGSNGLAFDKDGDIILCQHGDRRIASISNTATINPNFKTIIDNYNGKRFNSPNDLSISSDGDIYFTDPPYGFYYNQKTFDDKFRELDFNGVFKQSKDGSLHLITKEMSLPNGIALSNDEKYVYVNNCGTEDPKIMKFNTSTFEGKLFFDGSELSKKHKGCFDGLKVHSSGNIFTTAPNGILIISPEGVLIATINYGKPITNCNFDTNEQYLYVTGFDNISRIKLK